MSRHTILALNQIASQGLRRFPSDRYNVGKSVEHPMRSSCGRTTCTGWRSRRA
jgi:hypothetical protein